MGNELVIGVDISTTSTKAIIYDQKGKEIATGRSEYKVLRPRPGWSEQKAEWWWEAFCQACRQAVSHPQVKAESLRAIGITHQRQTFVPVDSQMKPLRDAILWNDTRCGKQAEWATQKLGIGKIYERTGLPPGTWSLYKTIWLKEKEPDVFKATCKFLMVPDYVIYLLTGEIATSSGTAALTGGLDITNPDKWAEDVMETYGVPLNKWVTPILSGGEVVGRVSSSGEKATGLPKGLSVVLTAGDQPCGTLGVGITEPGIMGINGGTSCCSEVYTPELPMNPSMSYFIEVSPLGGYLPESAVNSGVSALMSWYRDNFAYEEQQRVKKSGEDVWDIIYNQAKDVPAGSLGLMVVPFFQGALAPYWDIRSRGVIAGFLMDHGKPHLVRAIMEGQAYESQKMREMMEEGTGILVKELRMYGGAAKSDIWNQIFADIMNVVICTTSTTETTALGAAICAAKGGGVYSSMQEAVRAMVKLKDRYVPDPETAGLYSRLYEEGYKPLYGRIQHQMHQISVITGHP